MMFFLNQKQKMRQSNFELLRIISMLMIVAHHFVVHGEFGFQAGVFSLSHIYLNIFSMGGKIGVNIFVLISAYFLLDSPSFRISKVIKLWAQIVFYSSLILIISFFYGSTKLNIFEFIIELIKSFFPVITGAWGFASAYFLLYLFSGFINKFIAAIDKKSYKLLLLIMTFFWCIIPSFTIEQWNVQCSELLWFIYLYLLMGYYRRYKSNGKLAQMGAKSCILLSLAGGLITVLSVVVLSFIGSKIHYFENTPTHFLKERSILMLLIAIFLFFGFTKISINSRVINVISSSTFGVFLIHDHKSVREFLWLNLFHSENYENLFYTILYSMIVVIIVFLACSAIDLIRQYLFEPIYLRCINYIVSPCIKKFKRIINEQLNK